MYLYKLYDALNAPDNLAQMVQVEPKSLVWVGSRWTIKNAADMKQLQNTQYAKLYVVGEVICTFTENIGVK